MIDLIGVQIVDSLLIQIAVWKKTIFKTFQNQGAKELKRILLKTWLSKIKAFKEFHWKDLCKIIQITNNSIQITSILEGFKLMTSTKVKFLHLQTSQKCTDFNIIQAK